MKNILRNIIDFLRTHLPIEIFYIYHWIWASGARLFYGDLSKQIVLIGVMGAKGKSTTANLIWQIANYSGIKTGIISTNMVGIGNLTRNNEYHKTLPGRHHTFKLLKEMISAKCRVAVLEIPIEAIPFSRERYLNFDQIIFTNITDEKHRNFKHDLNKARQFYQKPLQRLLRSQIKSLILTNKTQTISKHLIYNLDRNELKNYYNSYDSSTVISTGYALNQLPKSELKYIYPAELKTTLFASDFILNFEKQKYQTHLNIGNEVNIANSLASIASTTALGIEIETVLRALADLDPIAGRYEIIKESPYTVIVDYAHEQLSFQNFFQSLMQVLGTNRKTKIIAHISAEGGGRDVRKRFPMGKIAGEYADYLVIGDCDPYEEDPLKILEDMAEGAKESGKLEGKDLFIIPDRKTGFNKCLKLAAKGDIVLFLTKGADQGINYRNYIMPWDDRDEARKSCNVTQLIQQSKLTKPAFLFDMDGVLINSTEYSLQALNEVLEHFGLQADVELMMKLIGTGTKMKYQVLSKYFANQISLDEFSYENYCKVFFKVSLEHSQNYQIIPGVINFLEKLYRKNYHIGLYSNSSPERFALIDRRLKLSQYFDQIILGDSKIAEKPAPDGYIELMARIGVDAKNCYIFEDSQNGIEAGFAAGGKVIAIGSKYDLEKLTIEPILTLVDFSDLSLLYKIIPQLEN